MTPEQSTALYAILEKHWGFSQLRPMQERAISAVLARRDSLVVLPTGGGKSLCYQAPALLQASSGLTLVVSPLIALMQDQVKGLRELGIAAVKFDSTQSQAEKVEAVRLLRQREAALVFASPERLTLPGFQEFLREFGVVAVAIDEAHCISQWGHDFRPDYRKLRHLREYFPGASIHAYTATATAQVQADIVEQLELNQPEILVGNFDRPNLTYRVWPRADKLAQIKTLLDRHRGHAGIIYALSKREVDELAATLQLQGYPAMAYHAGLTLEQRRVTLNRFIQEESPIVVATVAFGMGIDRHDVRFVVHVGIPKSIEAYQQEAGRAGRDGLPSECVLLYSGSDRFMLRGMMERSVAEATDRGEPPAPEFLANALHHLELIDRYARGSVCRHQALVQYFGQSLAEPNCQACDICLGEVNDVPDALSIAQKILSCVARVEQSYGINYVVSVLRGENLLEMKRRGHDRLSTFGLLRNVSKAVLKDWFSQLLSQELLSLTGDAYPVVKLTKAGWQLMQGVGTVRLITLAGLKPAKPGQWTAPRSTRASEPVDPALFERLRQKRRALAEQEQVPPYRILPDSVLLALATTKPKTLDDLRSIVGIGEVKLRAYGKAFLEVIQGYLAVASAAVSTKTEPSGVALYRPSARPEEAQARRELAFSLFRDRTYLVDVMQQLNVARSTAVDYLIRYITEEKPEDIRPWVCDAEYQEIASAIDHVGDAKLKSIFDWLHGEISYDHIKIVLAHRTARSVTR